MKRVLLLIPLLFCVHWALAQTLDSVRVSLITCSPGDEVYELYGHTALRCQNVTRGTDVVFNYGVFSFSQPNFIWRFVRGECDYMVMGVDWKYFPDEYAGRGSSITAQELNLTPLEANRLYEALLENCGEENRQYRYNFLYNNCTLKVRDMVEQAVMGRIVYPQTSGPEKKTYRQIIHEYARPGTWAAEGNDFLLGQSVDTVLTDRASMFAPEYLMHFVAGASVYATDGSLRPLVRREEVLLPANEAARPASPFVGWKRVFASPLLTACMFLLLFLLLVWIEWKSGHIMWLLDVPLLFAQGVVGAVLLFMRYFSEHPAVDANWLLWPFSPLALLALPGVVSAAFRHKRCWWHTFHLLYLTFFLIFSHWIPQDFGQIVVPLALALWTRPLSYIIYYRKNNCD